MARLGHLRLSLSWRSRWHRAHSGAIRGARGGVSWHNLCQGGFGGAREKINAKSPWQPNFGSCRSQGAQHGQGSTKPIPVSPRIEAAAARVSGRWGN